MDLEDKLRKREEFLMKYENTECQKLFEDKALESTELWISISLNVILFFSLFIFLLVKVCRPCLDDDQVGKDDKDELEDEKEKKLLWKYFDHNGLTITHDRLKLGPIRLGVGQFAEVRKGRAVFLSKPATATSNKKLLVGTSEVSVAIKIVFAGQGSELKLLQEAERLHKIAHDHIIRLRGVCLHSLNGPMMVMELLDGNLETYLTLVREKKRPDLTLLDVLRIVRQVAEAIEHLQRHGTIHRDIAARNVLLTDMKNINSGNIKLADFGLARFVDTDSSSYSVHDPLLPIAILPPEVFKNDTFCLKSDVWQFATFVWEFLMVGIPPHNGKPSQKIIQHVTSADDSKRCLQQPVACPDALYSLLCLCWALNPDDRPDFLIPANVRQDRFPHAIIPMLADLHLTSQMQPNPVILQPAIVRHRPNNRDTASSIQLTDSRATTPCTIGTTLRSSSGDQPSDNSVSDFSAPVKRAHRPDSRLDETGENAVTISSFIEESTPVSWRHGEEPEHEVRARLREMNRPSTARQESTVSSVQLSEADTSHSYELKPTSSRPASILNAIPETWRSRENSIASSSDSRPYNSVHLLNKGGAKNRNLDQPHPKRRYQNKMSPGHLRNTKFRDPGYEIPDSESRKSASSGDLHATPIFHNGGVVNSAFSEESTTPTSPTPPATAEDAVKLFLNSVVPPPTADRQHNLSNGIVNEGYDRSISPTHPVSNLGYGRPTTPSGHEPLRVDIHANDPQFNPAHSRTDKLPTITERVRHGKFAPKPPQREPKVLSKGRGRGNTSEEHVRSRTAAPEDHSRYYTVDERSVDEGYPSSESRSSSATQNGSQVVFMTPKANTLYV